MEGISSGGRRSILKRVESRKRVYVGKSRGGGCTKSKVSVLRLDEDRARDRVVSWTYLKLQVWCGDRFSSVQ